MVSVPEATSIILAHLFEPTKEKVSLTSSSGRILAESIRADRDLPPFDRVTMDGIAIRSSDFGEGIRSFTITGVQAAGQPPMKLNDSGACLEVMTGSMLPEGADTVVCYEDLEIRDRIAHIRLEKISTGENIHFRGMDARKNDILFAPGIRISPAEIALMAATGKSIVEVYALPRTAIVSTGDELVPVDQIPMAHQIRQSNVFALEAALLEMKCTPRRYHIGDQKEALEKDLQTIFKNHELIILSGGVSKGKFDFVPQILESLGIKKLFHQVSQKPGKPFWFGVDDRHTVFALPGNPVSTYLCFYRYIKPWLTRSMGADSSFHEVILAKPFSFAPRLTYFLQVKIRGDHGKSMAYPEPGGGSGDFANLKAVDGFLELPPEQTDFKPGDLFAFIPFRN